MSEPVRTSVIMPDTVVEGDMVARGPITVSGRIQGTVSAPMVEISEGGEIYGSLKAKSADVYGSVQGDVSILGHIRIGRTGSVNGQVRYGSISMEQGASLDASLRNVPPRIGGDFEISVARGGSVKITTLDLTAFDPDDAAKDLTYSVTNPKNGFVALDSARTTAITQFTQADLEANRVVFVHDGSASASAGFDTVVTDSKGGTSGEVRHVTVLVAG